MEPLDSRYSTLKWDSILFLSKCASQSNQKTFPLFSSRLYASNSVSNLANSRDSASSSLKRPSVQSGKVGGSSDAAALSDRWAAF